MKKMIVFCLLVVLLAKTSLSGDKSLYNKAPSEHDRQCLFITGAFIHMRGLEDMLKHLEGVFDKMKPNDPNYGRLAKTLTESSERFENLSQLFFDGQYTKCMVGASKLMDDIDRPGKLHWNENIVEARLEIFYPAIFDYLTHGNAQNIGAYKIAKEEQAAALAAPMHNGRFRAIMIIAAGAGISFDGVSFEEWSESVDNLNKE